MMMSRRVGEMMSQLVRLLLLIGRCRSCCCRRCRYQTGRATASATTGHETAGLLVMLVMLLVIQLLLLLLMVAVHLLLMAQLVIELMAQLVMLVLMMASARGKGQLAKGGCCGVLLLLLLQRSWQRYSCGCGSRGTRSRSTGRHERVRVKIRGGA